MSEQEKVVKTKNENVDGFSENDEVETANFESEVMEPEVIESEIVESEVVDEKVTEISVDTNSKYCSKCGAELQLNQAFCSNCGQKVDSKSSTGKNGLIKIIAAVGAVAVLVLGFFLIRGVPVKDVTLNKDSLVIKVGETSELTYTINPEDAKNKSVEWTSSNEAIAVVENGQITAKNEGDCIITVESNNGKTDTCSIIVEPAGPDLVEIYNECCDDSFALVANDGSYLVIDTNPNNVEDYFSVDAYTALYTIHDMLELPESVMNKMSQTRALDGMQSETHDGIEITWTYHPDNGLEVMYSVTE